MGDAFFECPWVWLFAACVLVPVMLATCDRYDDGYDPYCWQGGSPDGADVACYEEELLANSLPPCGDAEVVLAD